VTAPRELDLRKLGWWLAFAALALYVAARMGGFRLWADVATPAGSRWLPNTFATVDHPFHVARAATLWRELGAGHLLRWVGQHQGGYPVEFYPLGQAWLEVSLRALSLGWLPAEAAHTLVTIALFLVPGLAFVGLARLDGLTPGVAFLALVLHVALPGGWYDGGYTELVQWGLITNVAAATASFLMLPVLIRYLASGDGWSGALSGALAAFAIYCNPRSLVALLAVGCGAWLAAILSERGTLRRNTARLVLVAIVSGLLAAPELVSLARFDDFYSFVRYSGYDSFGSYVSTAVSAVTWPVALLAVAGVVVGLFTVRLMAARTVAMVFILYVLLTVIVAFVPPVAAFASQLEPTRLMPLQRLLTIYSAALATWSLLSWLSGRRSLLRTWVSLAEVLILALAVLVLVVQTRPLPVPPDLASPEIPAAGLYSVAMSAQPVQADLEAAVQAADAAAAPGTAMLILGSGLSWHQQLWAPLWTSRPLFYDNWLWFWHPYHAGTPAYTFWAGHHYPDPERTLDQGYLARHGIGAVLVTGSTRGPAAASPLLQPLRRGTYDAYLVIDPVTTVTFGAANAATSEITNQRVEASAAETGAPAVVRVNWYPRWQGRADGQPVALSRRADGYMDVDASSPPKSIDVEYAVKPADWVARTLAVIGAVVCGWLCLPSARKVRVARPRALR
jgi:hypothetical protein